MRFAYFTHSLVSCWNHGNAHFVRGVHRELAKRGHRVRALEPADGWSRANLLRDHGTGAIQDFNRHFPDLRVTMYGPRFDVAAALAEMDVVIVHEWTDPELIVAIGRLRRSGADFLLLFHDTHHRAVSDPEAVRLFDPSAYDGGLVFGEALAEIYRAQGWDAGRIHVWHEAADTTIFRPLDHEEQRRGVVWVGNWGDGERNAEIEQFLLNPVAELGLPLDIYGVRYPRDALDRLDRYGAAYHGWLPNARVPELFARHVATIHVPRRFYTQRLPGIPTIRVFEALACGIPLICAPWSDSEGLFRPGEDFAVARSGDEMRRELDALMHDPDRRAYLAANGLARIRARHTCAHRVDELLQIVESLRPTLQQGVA
ncbi:MAG: hypothetical protein QOK29_1454 [Rhodospirillaceae bacterium]|jgi:spore maturation protein CgeB|nr:hypothetical protein [Rhodospirillaceae bacterium]